MTRCGTKRSAEGCQALTYVARGRDLPCLPCRNQVEVSSLRSFIQGISTYHPRNIVREVKWKAAELRAAREASSND